MSYRGYIYIATFVDVFQGHFKMSFVAWVFKDPQQLSRKYNKAIKLYAFISYKDRSMRAFAEN